MEIKWLVIILSFCYLIFLFLIASWAEKNANKSWLNSPYIYSLSLAVYCTAWTYYGSVGRASHQGLDFLTTYLGPVMLAPLFWIVLRKIIRISKVHRITNMADFVASRYGKNATLGAIITVFCFLGVLPYISIQLKAISNSYLILSEGSSKISGYFLDDTSFYITVVLAVFTILFGARNIDANQKNVGLITTIAFESVFKLLAFLALGLYVTFGLFDGFGNIFQQAANLEQFNALVTIDDSQYGSWMALNILSALALLFLPRQFHVAVKENRNENHLKKALWLFPLYLLLINLFVIPIALGGKMIFQDQNVNADTYVLAIPLAYDNNLLALIIFLGGFSAATSMIIVSTSALSIMVSNHIITPNLIKSRLVSQYFKGRLDLIVLRGRQMIIMVMLFLAYLYFKFVGDSFSLVSIGLISFVAVAQLAPAIIGGIYWKMANRKGALVGLLAGFMVWFYILVVPTMVSPGIITEDFVENGPFHWSWLSPHGFLGLDSMDYIVSGFFWSMFFNVSSFLVVSTLTHRSTQEINQAEIFVDIFKYSSSYESSILWKGRAFISDLKRLISQFLGGPRTERAFRKFMTQNNIEEKSVEADYRIVNYAEKLLSGAIGSTSARVLMASVVKEENVVDIKEVFDILREAQQYISYNKQLEIKSQQLEEAGQKLREANEKLKAMDHIKDEFISTVTHEMRTPITSIRAMSEILNDHQDISGDERTAFLNIIVEETKRMERLINQVLNIEKLDSGELKMPLDYLNLNEVVETSLSSVSQWAKEKKIAMTTSFDPNLSAIRGNNDGLTQVVLNLLSNAIKYCNQEQGQVDVVTSMKGNEVELKVIDNGPGIPVEMRKLIFEAFYQAKNQENDKPEGSGLGLTICKKIIDKHNGKIWVDDNHQPGAVVALRVPAI